ncbi:cyclin-A1-4 isoform X5 [Ziziphus jujuba]|uniref:B-like cyclin n=1 Tax=Ziziphus jujuba TaxID=326968 RepID=A0ABM3ILF7_ZIZJJ|nr:cyclin-A1-4 isoform X5 [Ziziphus jujuba]
MSTCSHNQPPSSSSSSSSSAKMHLNSHNPSKRVTATSKNHLAKKRQALADVTNQKNGSQRGSRTSVSSSEPRVACVAKIAKIKKEFSTCSRNAGLSECTLSASMSSKSTVLVPISNASSPGTLQPIAEAAASPCPRRKDTVLTTQSNIVDEPRCVDASPCRSVSGSISLDQSISTCDSLRSPEFEYIDNMEASGIKSIERKTSNSLYISDDLEVAGSRYYKDIFAKLERIEKVVDIDKNFTDPQFCASIASDIFKNLHAAEATKRPSVNFMGRIQKDINANMRAILVDWLVEVAEEYMLVPDTLFLTINYIDRYLSGNVMNRKHLQLLGVACMMIAAKYEEISPPSVEEFCYVTDNTFSKEEVLKMETSVLNYLKFEMTAPTAIGFSRRFVSVAQVTSENSTLRYYTFYKASDLSDCVKALHHLYRNGISSNLPAVREKYSQHKYKFVAKKYCPMSIPPEFFEDLND